MNYCTSCGLPIPDGQGKSCSRCYGDPWHGSDGYLLREMEEQERREREKEFPWEQHWEEKAA